MKKRKYDAHAAIKTCTQSTNTTILMAILHVASISQLLPKSKVPNRGEITEHNDFPTEKFGHKWRTRSSAIAERLCCREH